QRTAYEVEACVDVSRVLCRSSEGDFWLHHPPLPQPEIAFAREQSFPKNVPVRPQNAPFDVAARVADQNFLDEVGVIDKNITKIDHADADDIAAARQFAEHLQRVLTQRAERPAFEPSVRARGEFEIVAAPHTNMLSRGLPRGQRGCG